MAPPRTRRPSTAMPRRGTAAPPPQPRRARKAPLAIAPKGRRIPAQGAALGPGRRPLPPSTAPKGPESTPCHSPEGAQHSSPGRSPGVGAEGHLPTAPKGRHPPPTGGPKEHEAGVHRCVSPLWGLILIWYGRPDPGLRPGLGCFAPSGRCLRPERVAPRRPCPEGPRRHPPPQPRRAQKAPAPIAPKGRESTPCHSPEGAQHSSPGRSPGSRATAPPPTSTAPKGRRIPAQGAALGPERRPLLPP